MLVLPALSLVLAIVAAPAAHSHPFGDPQTAELDAEGDVVRLRWTASPDDLTALALSLQVLKERRTYVYDRGVLVPEESDESDAVVLAGAPEFEAYLLDRVSVTQAGTDCAGVLADVDDLVSDGALVTFTCPAPVADVEVGVETLTDLHEAYRTLATASDGERATYSSTAPTHTWSFTEEGGLSGPAGQALGLVVGVVAVALLVMAGVLWRRRKVLAAR